MPCGAGCTGSVTPCGRSPSCTGWGRAATPARDGCGRWPWRASPRWRSRRAGGSVGWRSRRLLLALGRLRRPSGEGGQGPGRGGGGRLVGLLELEVDLLAVDVHVAGGLDPDPHVVTVDLEHRDDDVVTDDEALLRATAEHQHARVLSAEAEPDTYLMAAACGPARPEGVRRSAAGRAGGTAARSGRPARPGGCGG